MDAKTIVQLNDFINSAYECTSFMEFLRLAILSLHKFVLYDSGMFYCAISHDCSYFKPYQTGDIVKYYSKEEFAERTDYLEYARSKQAGNEVCVYKQLEYTSGIISVPHEPRSKFLEEQNQYHIACLRIVYKGQFLGEIYLHRDNTKPDFTDSDLFILSLLQPHVSTVFNIIHMQLANKSIEQENRNTSVGMCSLDKDLAIVSINASALQMLKVTTIFGASVLHHVKELCMDSTCDKNKKTDKLTDLVKTKDTEIKLTIYTYPIQANDNIRHIVLMQYLNEGQLVSDYRFKFTKREADIIDGLIQGKNNARLAAALAVSENTIKTHIKSIYNKTGANNRTELTYLLMMSK